MKNRLTALDGLRGFAAFSVLLSHTGFNVQQVAGLPILIATFKVLSVGPNSVQIFFVLCGFLMAYLYPSIKDELLFLHKRYARIYPVFGVVVIFLWLIELERLTELWYQQALLMIALAALCSFLWHVTRGVSRSIFFSFMLFQLGMIIFNNVLSPKIFGSPLAPGTFSNIVTMFTNLSMTTEFTRNIIGLSGVFWSLTPEVIFYLLYPFFVIPLIKLSKKYGFIFSILVIIGVTKILVDLDTALLTYQSLISLNIARASGFIAGIVVGTIFREKGETWKKFEKIFSYQLVGFLVLSALVLIQYGDLAIRDGNSRSFMILYYIVSSWIFAIVVISAIIKKTLINRLFNWQVLRFLGTISYSLYLTHQISIDWARTITSTFFSKTNQLILFQITYLALSIGLSIGLAWILFSIVEKLYFRSKKPVETISKAKKTTQPLTETFKFSYLHLAGMVVVSILLVVVYSGEYSPTILVKRHTLPQYNLFTFNTETSLLNQNLHFPVKASYDNLSIVAVNMRYVGKSAEVRKQSTAAKLDFVLYEQGKNKPIYQSTRSAYDIESAPIFPFGFPPIQNSKGKYYAVELKLKNASKGDYVSVNTYPDSLITEYTTSKADILRKPYVLPINRLLFILQNPGGVFALVFLSIIGLFVYKQIRVRSHE